MKLTILGSGSPEATAQRASSGYLLEIGSDVLLFDCGGGVVDNLLRAGFQPEDVTHLFFSHLHSDHMMDYARLVHAAWDARGTSPLVFGPKPIGEITEKLFGESGVFAHDLRARTEFKPSQDVWVARGKSLPRPWPKPEITQIAPGFAYQGMGWELTTCAVPHGQPLLECMGLAVTADGAKLVYSGDAGLCDALRAMSEEADLLLHWCYRMDGEAISPELDALCPTPSEIGSMARAAAVKTLALTHFRTHMDATAVQAEIMTQAEGAFGGPVVLAKDLMVLDIQSKDN